MHAVINLKLVEGTSTSITDLDEQWGELTASQYECVIDKEYTLG